MSENCQAAAHDSTPESCTADAVYEEVASVLDKVFSFLTHVLRGEKKAREEWAKKHPEPYPCTKAYKNSFILIVSGTSPHLKRIIPKIVAPYIFNLNFVIKENSGVEKFKRVVCSLPPGTLTTSKMSLSCLDHGIFSIKAPLIRKNVKCAYVQAYATPFQEFRVVIPNQDYLRAIDLSLLWEPVTEFYEKGSNACGYHFPKQEVVKCDIRYPHQEVRVRGKLPLNQRKKISKENAHYVVSKSEISPEKARPSLKRRHSAIFPIQDYVYQLYAMEKEECQKLFLNERKYFPVSKPYEKFGYKDSLKANSGSENQIHNCKEFTFDYIKNLLLNPTYKNTLIESFEKSTSTKGSPGKASTTILGTSGKKDKGVISEERWFNLLASAMNRD